MFTNLWDHGHQTVSFEFFPPKSEKAEVNLGKAIDKLLKLGPDFVSVTFGAGGLTREGSHQLVSKLKLDKGFEKVLPYMACYGLGPDDLKRILDKYKELGIDTIFAVRGDRPQGIDNFTEHPESLAHASDFLSFIRTNYDFTLGAAGYPEGHVEAKSIEEDIKYLKLKVENGARFIISQYFYDNSFYFDFVQRCREADITVPIVAGVMPIYNVKLLENLASLCGATITEEVKEELANISPEDKSAVSDFGIEFATKQCRELLEKGASGLHFYTMNRSKSVLEIINRLREEKVLHGRI